MDKKILVGIGLAVAVGGVYLSTRKTEAQPPITPKIPIDPDPDTGLWTCPYCSEQFETQADLNLHIETEHPVDVPIETSELSFDILSGKKTLSGVGSWQMAVLNCKFSNNNNQAVTETFKVMTREYSCYIWSDISNSFTCGYTDWRHYGDIEVTVPGKSSITVDVSESSVGPLLIEYEATHYFVLDNKSNRRSNSVAIVN